MGKRAKEKVMAAEHVLSHSPGISKAQLALTLGFSRSLWYMPRVLPVKDRVVATQIEKIHEDDDTLGARSLAPMLKMGKARIARVMKEYGIVARPRKRAYYYPGKSPVIYPNLLREDERELLDRLIVYSDIFQFRLADGSLLYGCFALLRQTRQVLSLCFDYSMRSDLVSATVSRIDFLDVADALFHTDQGKQFGSFETLLSLVDKGFILSMSRAGTPTDNPFAERFVSTFKHAVVRRRPYNCLGEFLTAAENWINFYNETRPHQGINNLTPNAYAESLNLPRVPYLSNLTV